SAGPRTLPAEDELAEQAHAHPGRPLHPGRVLAIGVRRAGDVEVDPGEPVHELAQEPPRRDAAGWTPAGVLHVGDVGLHELAILVPQRQRPDALAGSL